MFNRKNNLVFLLIHIFLSVAFWLFYFANDEAVFWERKIVLGGIIVLVFLGYSGIAYGLSGNLITLGQGRTNLLSVSGLAILLFLAWLSCFLRDDGRFLSEFVWWFYLCALGAVGCPSFLCWLKGGYEYYVLTLFLAFLPSFFFWLGICLKSWRLKKYATDLSVTLD